jgi:hypothetical protein
MVVGQLLPLSAIAQVQVTNGRTNHVEKVKTLSEQLRWHDEAGQEKYAATKDEVTRQVLNEIDAFVSDSFQPSSATAELVRAGLDALLGHKSGDVIHDLAFSVDLPRGHFLIAGIELSRGGDAIADDAISFRAYKAVGNRLVFAANTDNFSDSSLVDLHAEALSDLPAVGEFWFMAMAEVPPQSPPTVAMRLYAFDGEKFRTIWKPRNIIAADVDKAIEVTTGGFVVDSLFDPTGGAAHSPSVVIHEQYVLTAGEPEKVAEWRTGIQ